MEIRRFFATQNDVNDKLITLRGDEFLHMTKVLRYKVGYTAVVCLNDGIERTCKVVEIGKDYAVLQCEDEIRVDSKSSTLTLFCGVLKNNKLDLVVQKCVELGVDKIVPFTSRNTVENKFNRDRAQKIALESAKQCGSTYLTEINELTDFDSVVRRFGDYDRVIFAFEDEKRNNLKKLNLMRGNIALVVGAEGGFTTDEAQQARDCGADVITLGKRILRAETASIVLATLTLDALGELDYD